MEKDLKHLDPILVESCGLCWQLDKIYREFYKRSIITITFTGKKEDLLQRLKDRQHKRKINYKYDFSDEERSIEYILTNIYRIYPKASLVINSSEKDTEEQYQLTKNFILEKLIKGEK